MEVGLLKEEATTRQAPPRYWNPFWEDKAFQFRKNLLIFWEDKTFWAIKTLKNFCIPSHLYIGLWWSFKNIWKYVTVGSYIRKSLLVIDYNNGVIDYTVTSEELWLFIFEIGRFKHCNRLPTYCNRLHNLKFKFQFLMAILKRSKPLVIDYKTCVIDYMLSKIFKTFSESILGTANQLHLLVIDYQRVNFNLKWFR